MPENFVPEANCWKQSGVFGDCTCQLLARIGHCRNCEHYAKAGRSLFDREIPIELAREWTLIAAKPKQERQASLQSLVVFRAAEEWLAVKSANFLEITGNRAVRPIPGRSDDTFLGLTNISGELTLCFDLARALNLGGGPDKSKGAIIVAELKSERFALRVAEALGVFKLASDELAKLPDTLAKSEPKRLDAVFELMGRQVGLLNEERLHELLTRSLRG